MSHSVVPVLVSAVALHLEGDVGGRQLTREPHTCIYLRTRCAFIDVSGFAWPAWYMHAMACRLGETCLFVYVYACQEHASKLVISTGANKKKEYDGKN